MDDRNAWPRARYGVLLTVLAVHLCAIVLLIASSKSLRLSLPAATFLEMVPPPPPIAQRVRADQSSSPTLQMTRVTPSLDAALSLSPELVPALGTFGIPIDWADQAHAVADSVTADTDRRDTRSARITTAPRKSVFSKPSAHHAGEQHRLDTGEWIVFISDNCYQISSAMPPVPVAAGNGAGQSTFCLDDSDTPRGDLFDQLPAYQKHHPN